MSYRVFISFKHHEEDGRCTTRDFLIAQDVHVFLREKGIEAFFSPATLEEIGSPDYKRTIDQALETADVLIAIGTSRRNFESTWVRYEWDGFISDILSKVKPHGRVIVVTEGLKPQELPRALRQYQSLEFTGRASLEKLLHYVDVKATEPQHLDESRLREQSSLERVLAIRHDFGEVVGAYESRRQLFKAIPFEEICQRARKLDAIGLSLHAITLELGRTELTRMFQENACTVRLLFLKPHSSECKRREAEEGYKDDELSSLTSSSIKLVQRIRSELPHDKVPLLVAKTYESPVRINMIILDDNVMILQHYVASIAGKDAPVFLLVRRTASGMFAAYRNVFDAEWEQANLA